MAKPKSDTVQEQELKTLTKQVIDLQDRTAKWYGVFCAETNGFLIEINRLIRQVNKKV